MVFQTRYNRGFTLIEVIVAVFGFSLIAFGLIGLVSSILSSTNQQTSLLSSEDLSRKTAYQLINELRNAGYGSNGAYPLATAGGQSLVFYSNVNRTPEIEKIRYFVQGGQLLKGVTPYSGGTYDAAKEKISLAQDNVANGTGPLFYYYDGSYEGASSQAALAEPVNATLVKYIKLDLKVYKKAGVKNVSTYNITAGGAIRNLKTNLGE